MAVFSKLVPAFATAFGIQAAAAAIFVPLESERLYDFSGCIGFLSATYVSLYYPSLKAKFIDKTLELLPGISSLAPRQILVSAALSVWSIRLGSFLVRRIFKNGGDSRFDTVKKQPRTFAFFWFAQAVWISLVGLPVYLCNVVPSSVHPPLGTRDYAGLGLFIGGLIWEVVADGQKSIWRAKKEKKEHQEKFITSGLWSLSRHPKLASIVRLSAVLTICSYVGEVTLWTGIWLASTEVLQTPYFPRFTSGLAALASPVLTYYLLRHVRFSFFSLNTFHQTK
jgi:steroid 5-alpha reductase family enzyme